MCTALSMSNGAHYFGRNLDYDVDYPVSVVVTCRNKEIPVHHLDNLKSHNAMIGMAMIQNDFPLYFEATNEKGVGMAGLAFAEECQYFPVQEGKNNLASYELIPYLLGRFDSVAEIKEFLENGNVTNDGFSADLPAAPLHWIVSDKEQCIVLESTKAGLNIYDNPWGVLANCPEFPWHATNLSNYINLTGNIPTIQFAKDMPGLSMYSRGMGSIGLPGGVDSASRFVRCVFTKENSFCPQTEHANVSEFFHILGNVQQVNGETEVNPGSYEVTLYTSCCNTETGVYYYTTYYNQSVNAVDMHKCDLDSDQFAQFEVQKDLQVTMAN